MKAEMKLTRETNVVRKMKAATTAALRQADKMQQAS
jgi:hypothetical protein